MTLLPALKKLNPQVQNICDVTGSSAKMLASKYHIQNCTSDYTEILNDEDINLVMVITRHNLHARMVIECLKAGKHVYVEKPLALNESELKDIENVYRNTGKSIMVGFNRRFSPHARHIWKYLDNNNPINVSATMNAGFIPADSWVQDPDIGGGRIIGEACHFMDLMIYLTGYKVTGVCMNALGKNPDKYTDNATILLKFENGSQGVINYFSNGAKAYSKERIEVYSMNRTFVIDNFRKTSGYGARGFKTLKTQIDKGHQEQFRKLISSIESGDDPLIPFDELINSSMASFAALESLVSGEWVRI
jgi:predicted dehydrogenase